MESVALSESQIGTFPQIGDIGRTCAFLCLIGIDTASESSLSSRASLPKICLFGTILANVTQRVLDCEMRFQNFGEIYSKNIAF